LVPGFKPKRLHAYRVLERLKPEVDWQIQEMLDNGIIRPSHSPMASPLGCVFKGKEGCNGVRLAVNYRYVYRFTRDVAYPLPDISSVFQRIGHCDFMTVADCKAGYCQSFEELKCLLCKATVEPLYIVDFAKPFNLFVDARLHTVSAVLTQTGDNGTELPAAFSSTKLSQAQTAWSTIERESI